MPLPNKLVAVAIDKDRGSQVALKWTVDHLLARGQTVLLIHIKLKQSGNASGQSSSTKPNQISDEGGSGNIEMDGQTKELFLPFRVFCTRKDIHCYAVVLDDTDVAKAIVEYVNRTGVEVLIVGATTRGGLLRFKAKDIPGGMLKGAPDFSTVHVISKSGKISSTRAASRPAPFVHPLRHQLMQPASTKFTANSRSSFQGGPKPVCDPPPSTLQSDTMSIKEFYNNFWDKLTKINPQTKVKHGQELIDSIAEIIQHYIRKEVMEQPSIKNMARKIFYQEGDRDKMINDYLEEVRRNLLQNISQIDKSDTSMKSVTSDEETTEEAQQAP